MRCYRLRASTVYQQNERLCCFRRPCGRGRGFTIIELMIVIAIMVIMSGVSIPVMRASISSQRLQEVAWQMVQDLRLVKEDAILYQQDLNVYINFDSTKTIALNTVQPLNPANKDNRSYLFETFQWGKDQTLDDQHYIPGDSSGSHFAERVLKYGIVIESITSTNPSSITIGLKNYCIMCFRSGAGSAFRGEGDLVTAMDAMNNRKNSTSSIIGNSKLVVELNDPSTNKVFYVIVEGTGKISMYGSLPS